MIAEYLNKTHLLTAFQRTEQDPESTSTEYFRNTGCSEITGLHPNLCG